MDLAKELADVLKRIKSRPGLEDVIVVDENGEIMTSVLKNYKNNPKKMNVANYSELMNMLTTQAKNVVRDLDPTNDLMVLRIGTKKRKELLVSSKENYTVIVTHKIPKKPKEV